MYICMKDNLPPTNRQQHGRATRDGGRKEEEGVGVWTGRKRKRLRGVNEMEKNVPAFWVRLRYLLQKKWGEKYVSERERHWHQTLLHYDCASILQAERSHAHIHALTLSAEGIEKRDTLNIKALVNTDEESVLLFSCACMCASMLFAHVVLWSNKNFSAVAVTHIRSNTPPSTTRKKGEKWEGERMKLYFKKIYLAFFICVCVFILYWGLEKGKNKEISLCVATGTSSALPR